MAFLLKQYYEDKLAIAIETINKNLPIAMSMTIPILKDMMTKEEAILLANVVLFMTPLPLIIHFIWNKIRLVHLLIFF